MTTFSLRVAEKTITSAMSSGVNGSTPLLGDASVSSSRRYQVVGTGQQVTYA